MNQIQLDELKGVSLGDCVIKKINDEQYTIGGCRAVSIASDIIVTGDFKFTPGPENYSLNENLLNTRVSLEKILVFGATVSYRVAKL